MTRREIPISDLFDDQMRAFSTTCLPRAIETSTMLAEMKMNKS
jgi:hypothetical protein